MDSLFWRDSLVHADETKISIEGKNAFIWSLTNLEEVAYFYTETRDGDFLQELLKDPYNDICA